MIDPSSGEEWDVAKKCDALEMEMSSVLQRYLDEFCNLDEELSGIGLEPKENIPFVAILGILDKIRMDFYFENRIAEEGGFEDDVHL